MWDPSLQKHGARFLQGPGSSFCLCSGLAWPGLCGLLPNGLVLGQAVRATSGSELQGHLGVAVVRGAPELSSPYLQPSMLSPRPLGLPFLESLQDQSPQEHRHRGRARAQHLPSEQAAHEVKMRPWTAHHALGPSAATVGDVVVGWGQVWALV